MNKDGIVEYMRESGGMKKKDAEKALDLVLEAITQGLIEDCEVRIFKFGLFRAKYYGLWNERKHLGRRVVRFRASDCLRDRVTPPKNA